MLVTYLTLWTDPVLWHILHVETLRVEYPRTQFTADDQAFLVAQPAEIVVFVVLWGERV